MAAAEDCLPALLEAGVRVLSVPPAALGTTKAALAAL
jgi:phosphoenolpyruvate-protein kinase (PTS system EI component)